MANGKLPSLRNGNQKTSYSKTKRSELPDAQWINRKLDVCSVAAELGIRRRGVRFHCWRPENHAHGDADPSVGCWKEANRLKCFVCGRPPIGVIDLVMEVRKLGFHQAIEWIDSCFNVPRIPRRKRTDRPMPRHLDSVLDPISFLVRSHIYSRLSPLAQRLAPALIACSEKIGVSTESERRATVSYRALMRYSGLRSPNAVRKGIEGLTLIGWLRATSQRAGLLKTTTEYLITPFAESVVEVGHALAREERMAIEYERAAAKRRRIERQSAFRAKSNRKVA